MSSLFILIKPNNKKQDLKTKTIMFTKYSIYSKYKFCKAVTRTSDFITIKTYFYLAY